MKRIPQPLATSPEASTEEQEACTPAPRFFNRELSWLEFNDRILCEAERPSIPLLERIRFLSISASNLDEFFTVRIAGLKRQVRDRINVRSIDGLSPAAQLQLIEKRVDQLCRRQATCLAQLETHLADSGIVLCHEPLSSSELNSPELSHSLQNVFRSRLYPILTPLAIDPAHPFPFIPNMGLTVAMTLQNPMGSQINALVRIPNSPDRFVRIRRIPHAVAGEKKDLFISIERVIQQFVGFLFPGYEVLGFGVFRVIRDSDIEFQEEAEDLLRDYETLLRQRRRGRVIRIEFEESMPVYLRNFVTGSLRLRPGDVAALPGMIGLSDLGQLCDMERPELKFPPYTARFPERVRDEGGDCFASVRKKDFIVHHPYESFDVVLQFLRQAASDPDVLAIKQTLYRTSNDSPIVRALVEAAEGGKSVTAVVELKARFDEEANMRWARDLERAGAQVVYGFIEWKTHAKLSLVVRKEGDTLVSYVHLGTGNYHPITARVYTDLSFFTAEKAIAHDVAQIFNFVTGYARPASFQKLAVSHLTLRTTLLELIEHEIEHAKAGRPAAIWFKANSLADPQMIEALYAASNAGVSIDLVIRGICCLRPQVTDLSENIRVKSIVGRFLEHARIYCFGAGNGLPHPNALVYISSADLMQRNLDRRIETLVPLENTTVRAQVLDQILVANLQDTENSWHLGADGISTRPEGIPSDRKFDAHNFFMTNPSLSGRGADIHRPMPRRLVQPNVSTPDR